MCRALMMQNRYRRHYYRSLTTLGVARRRVADQFYRESRRRPINVTMARRLTLDALAVFVYVYTPVRSLQRCFDRNSAWIFLGLSRLPSWQAHPGYAL